MVELKIDQEFRDKIPPLTEEEFKQLEENILSDGEVYEPICVWKGTVVDGHNRYKIVLNHPEIPFRTKEMDFADKWAAFEWMYRKQLGRRNLSDEQKTYMIGKMYEARKNSRGGDRRSEEFSSGQDVRLKSDRELRDGKSGEISKDLGINEKTIRRAEHFAKGVDKVREVSKEAADKILQGESGASKSVVSEMKDANEKELQDFAEKVLSGDAKTLKPKGYTKADRKDRAETEAVVADLYETSTVMKMTVETLVDEISINAEQYVRTLRNLLTDNSTLLTLENKPIVAEAIQTQIINKILQLKGLIER